MDIKELLAKYGLTIPEDKAKDFDKEFRTTYKHHSELDTLQTKFDNATTQLTAANTKLEGYDPEWKTKAGEAQRVADEKVAQIQFDNALTAALSGSKAKNPIAVKALLDMNGLKQNGDTIVGLKEQLDKIKADNDYLFETETKAPHFAVQTPGADKNPAPGKNDEANAAIRAAFGRSNE